MERKNIWNLYSDEQILELKEINDKYKRCLDAGKTERECVELSVNMARDAGYRDLEEILRSGETLKAGDKVYAVNMNKMLALFLMLSGNATRLASSSTTVPSAGVSTRWLRSTTTTISPCSGVPLPRVLPIRATLREHMVTVASGEVSLPASTTTS